MSKYYYNKDYFSVIDTEDKAYWLGFLYADGCINRYYKNEKLKSMNLELTLCGEDYEHLEKFKKCLDSNLPIHKKIVKYNNKEYEAYRLNVCCTKMCYDLINLGCTPQKTYDIKFPSEDIIPHIYMKDFIRGFFDGDGCINITTMNEKPNIRLVITGMSDMLKSISDFLIDEKILRVIPKIHRDNRSKASSMFIYGNDSIKEVLDYLYKDSHIYLNRKYQTYINYYKNYDELEKRGVYWNNENKAYIVTIRINGKRIRIGQYKDLEDAINARKEAEIRKMNIESQPA